MSEPRVLLIDDDQRLFDLLSRYLAGHGVSVSWASDGARGLERLASGSAFDAVLLDVMMPGMDGLEVLRRLRARSRVPVIMLTARGEETDRIVGLELGADDYLPKPFNPRELLARLRAVLRRVEQTLHVEHLQIGEITLNLGAREVSRRGEPVLLTAAEFDMLALLAQRAGRVVSRDQLLQAAGRGDVAVGDRVVDVHISHLRQKLEEDSRDPALIKTIRGAGYIMSRGGA